MKFAETITEALGEAPELPERFRAMLDAPPRHVLELPNDVAALQELIAERAAER